MSTHATAVENSTRFDITLDGGADNEFARDEKVEGLIAEAQSKYELRRKVRDAKNVFTRTWIDDDKTGLYDPVEEQRRLRQRPRRPSALLKHGNFKPWDLDEDSDVGSEPRAELAPRTTPKIEVAVKFRSEAGRAKFREHVNSLPARSEPSEELFCEHRLRRRDSGVGFSHYQSAKSHHRPRLLDDLPDDLTGHPSARGCWGCVTIGIRCPLLDDDRVWPCKTCVEVENECELITPPTYKRACEYCKGKRMGCSYSYTLDHKGSCEECSRTGWRCIAGPAKESVRERISYDRDWENDPWQEPKIPKPKKAPSCRRCRERHHPCSFSAGDKAETCTACDMANEPCVPELEKPQSSRKRKEAQAKSKNITNGEHSRGDHNVDGGTFWAPDIFRPQAEKRRPITVDASDNDSEDDFLGNAKKPAVRSNANAKTKPEQKAIVVDVSSESSEDDFLGIAKKPLSRSRAKHKPKQGALTIDSGESSDDGFLGIVKKPGTKPKPKATPTKQRAITIDVSSDTSDNDGGSSDSSSLDLEPPPKRTKCSKYRTNQNDQAEGIVKSIFTKFAHPIQFNYTGQDSCHFCTDIRFAMFGLGSTEAEVIVWRDGRGLEEMSGGHRSQGIEATRMCVPCTTRRMPIVMCVKHELQPVDGEHALDVLADHTRANRSRCGGR